ncbi:MAG: hypothetical protein QFX35_00950 [Candidatus Verstraetearchaeota archaeon]|nr:hypothetical protein [Candidatus Verstraetearchaeota archaeon]
MDDSHMTAQNGMPGLREGEAPKSNEQRISKALEAVESGAVKKYVFKPSMRTVWIVVGKEREYQVIPKLYCQCDDFYINVVIRRKATACYHLIAQEIAESQGKYEKYNATDTDFLRLNKEWKRQTA